MKNVVFVLGNGESRLSIDLKYLREYGKIFGCNALYRDFSPDVLISVDDRMTTEIINSGYEGVHYHRILRKNRDKDNAYLVVDKNDRKITTSRGFSSGALALDIAANEAQIKEVYMLGFDLYKTEHPNNVYKDTPNYLRSTDRPVDASGFRIQIGRVIKENPTRKFIWVNDYHRKIFDAQNFDLMYVDEFKQKFKA